MEQQEQFRLIEWFQGDSLNIYITLLAFVVGFLIAMVIFRKPTKKKKIKELELARNTDVDMNNVMNSIYQSKDLYKEISKVCHPDRFINTDKHSLAEEIYKEVTKCKRDYAKLVALKNKVEQELKIKI